MAVLCVAGLTACVHQLWRIVMASIVPHLPKIACLLLRMSSEQKGILGDTI